MTVSERLREFALAEAQVPEAAEAVLRLSLIDWMAVGIAGAAEPVAGVMRALAGAEGGVAQATLFSGGRAPMRMAALVNGTISHALDYDDTHFAHIGHPSVGVIPAALAVAEAEGASGAAFQEAALIGMEAAIRFGIWLGRGHYQTGFHQTATAGAVGAAVAAGRLMRLNPQQMDIALGLVATRASGLKSQFGTMGKPFNAGLAAANGVEAALLAQLGIEARIGALEAPQGFGPTHHGAADESAFDGMGDSWLFETVSHKFHACCHGLARGAGAAAQPDRRACGSDRRDPGCHPSALDERVQPARPRNRSGREVFLCHRSGDGVSRPRHRAAGQLQRCALRRPGHPGAEVPRWRSPRRRSIERDAGRA